MARREPLAASRLQKSLREKNTILLSYFRTDNFELRSWTGRMRSVDPVTFAMNMKARKHIGVPIQREEDEKEGRQIVFPGNCMFFDIGDLFFGIDFEI